MLKKIESIYSRYPLQFILLVGFLLRLISVLFSDGYGMHDDHFLVIEAAQSWVDGFDYNNWLPKNSIDGKPTGHSWFYAGLHYCLFYFFDLIGFEDSKCKMLVIRFLHSIWSMITIYFGYKITEKMSGPKEAGIVGMLLAILWFYPILSVRTMVEMVCVPFMLISIYFLLKDHIKYRHYVIAGIFMGLAIAFRIQIYLIWGGVGLVLLFQKRFIEAIIFGISTICALFLSQVTDLFLWGYPFAEISQYILYNSTHYEDYITMSWFQYLIVLTGLLIPPVSLFILFGYFRSFRKLIILFLPSIIFILFHSIYPNKQERFILPVIPMVIIAGVIGWYKFYTNSMFWIKRKNLYRNILRFFWTLNLTALFFVSPAATKKSRVDSMYFLNELNDVSGLLLERTTNYGCYLMPRYYNRMWRTPHLCYSKDETSKYAGQNLEQIVRDKNINYCLFIEERDIEERLSKMKIYFPEMKFIEEFEPSYIDRLLHFLNPRNENEIIYLYKLY